MIRGSMRGFEEEFREPRESVFEEPTRRDHARLVESFLDERGAPIHGWVNGIGIANPRIAREFYALGMHPEDVSVLSTLPEEQPVIFFSVNPGALSTARPVIQQTAGQLGLGTPVFAHERPPAQAQRAPGRTPAASSPTSASPTSASPTSASPTSPSGTPSTTPTAPSAPPATPPSADSGTPSPTPHKGPSLRTALAIGLGAVGVLGLGAYWLKRKPSKFALAEYTINLEHRVRGRDRSGSDEGVESAPRVRPRLQGTGILTFNDLKVGDRFQFAGGKTPYIKTEFDKYVDGYNNGGDANDLYVQVVKL